MKGNAYRRGDGCLWLHLIAVVVETGCHGDTCVGIAYGEGRGCVALHTAAYQRDGEHVIALYAEEIVAHAYCGEGFVVTGETLHIGMPF